MSKEGRSLPWRSSKRAADAVYGRGYAGPVRIIRDKEGKASLRRPQINLPKKS